MFLLKKALLDNCTVTLKVIEQQHDIRPVYPIFVPSVV